MNARAAYEGVFCELPRLPGRTDTTCIGSMMSSRPFASSMTMFRRPMRMNSECGTVNCLPSDVRMVKGPRPETCCRMISRFMFSVCDGTYRLSSERPALPGQSHQKLGHPERSAARAKVGWRGVEGSREFEKGSSNLDRKPCRHSTGFFTAHRPAAKSPCRCSVQNDHLFFDAIALPALRNPQSAIR